MSSLKESSFAHFGLAEALVRAVEEIGYETPSPIQSTAIPPLLEGRDILGQAQTGTGKTAAFALPLLSRLDLKLARPQILVLTPTRELAIQVAEALQTYARYLPGFHVLPVYGGQSLSLQLRPLRRGVHAVVGTPGRILDHLRRGTLQLDSLASVVLDEADEMLRMGFIDDVESILVQTPVEKQVALFSATMPEPILRIARRHTRNPLEVRIKSSTATVSTVVQRYWQVTGVHKLDALTRILEVEDFDAMLVFVRTKTTTAELSERLEARGLSSAPLNGDMNQSARELTIERFKSGRLDILVATDVAARGLDVDRISHVVNYDIPYDTEAYVHRIGRTARAGRKGEAILFVAPRELRMLRAIERATGQAITRMSIPSHEDVADKRTARFKEKITDIIESQDLAPYESLIASYQTEHNVGLGEIAAALAYMSQQTGPQTGPQISSPTSSQTSRHATKGDQPIRSAPAKRAQRSQSVSESPSSPTRVTRSTSQEGEKGADRNRAAHGLRPARRKIAISQDADTARYRIEVGSIHGVEPKNIVGAIANEAGLDSQHIGAITIYDDHSIVDLPVDMPVEVFKHLQQVWVCGQRLKVSVAPQTQIHRKTAKPAAPGNAVRTTKSLGLKPPKIKLKDKTKPRDRVKVKPKVKVKGKDKDKGKRRLKSKPDTQPASAEPKPSPKAITPSHD